MTANRVTATATSVEILEALAQRGTAGVTEIATHVGGSKANVHKHLTTLEDAHFVQKRDGTYRLGHRFLEFANAAKRREPIYRDGINHLAKLADVTGATAVLVVREGDEGVYLHTIPPVRQRGADGLDGKRSLLHELPGGLAILSCSSRQERRSFLTRVLDSDEQVQRILDRLTTIERQSVVVSESEDSTGPEEIAAPVTAGDTPQGAIGIRKPTTGNESDRIETDLKKLVRNTAHTISNRLTPSE